MPSKIIFTTEQENHICDLYKKHRSTRKVANEANLSRDVIQKILQKNKIELATNSEHSKLACNSLFFTKLNNKSAYLLGFFIADGYISRPKVGGSMYIGVTIHKKDVEILNLFIKNISPQSKLVVDRNNLKFAVGDAVLAVSIAQYGINVLDKTMQLGRCLTLFEALKEKALLSHFVRGFMDGDGCIHVHKKYPKGNSTLNFFGTIDFLSELKSQINAELNISAGSLKVDNREKYKTKDKFAYLTYTGSKMVVLIGTWLYKNKKEYYLKRKFDKFSDVLKARKLRETRKKPNTKDLQ